MKIAVPLRVSQAKKGNLSEKILLLINKKNFFRHKYQRTGNPSFEKMMNLLVNIIRRKMSQLRNEKMGKTLLNAKPGDTFLWQLTKSRKRKRTAIPPLLTKDKIYLFTEKEKVNLFASGYSEVSLKNISFGPLSHRKKVLSTIQKWFRTNFIEPDDIKFTSPKEIFSILKECTNNKAPWSW